MTHSGLRPETEITLLLCARFGRNDANESPLTLGEFNHLLDLLRKNAIPFSNLLDQGALQDLEADPDGAVLISERIGPLLERGSALAAAVEGWENRGLWVIDRTAPDYPQRWIDRLADGAPPLLFGAGHPGLINQVPYSVAVTGSRDGDDNAQEFTRNLACQCAQSEHAIISGGARGIDLTSLTATLECGGIGVSILPGGLERASTMQQLRNAIIEERLVVVSPYHPRAGFSVGNAMGRNRLIYSLADIAVVVSSAAGSGGTWAGATEALRKGWLPVYVRQANDAPDGNQALLELGGLPLDHDLVNDQEQFAAWLASSHVSASTPDDQKESTRQLGLFSSEETV